MTCACSAWLFALPEIRCVAFGWVRSLVGLNAPPLFYKCRFRTTRSRTFVCCMVGLMIWFSLWRRGSSPFSPLRLVPTCAESGRPLR